MENKNIQYKDFIELQKAIKLVLSEFPNSKANFDFNRAPLARSAYEKFKAGGLISDMEFRSFFVKAILPKSGVELSEEEYNRLTDMFGSGVTKISLVDSNMLKWLKNAQKDEKILIIGGACALETRDLKLIHSLKNTPNSKDKIKSYVDSLFLNFPTWTQITGALIPSAKISVMYDETFPWHLKISEYGIENAEVETQKVYDKIFEGVQRYAKLYDPENIVVRVPFTSLNLKNDGYFDRWFDKTKKYNVEIREKYDLGKIEENFEFFMKAWVEYTYTGPEILDIVKKNLKENYEKIYVEHKIDNFTIHVRTKQIDHLDTERLGNWVHYIILGNDLPKNIKDRKNMFFTNHRINLIGLYNWMRDEFDNNPKLGFVGFLDHNFKGKFIHEEPVRGKYQIKKAASESLDLIFESPLRLTQKNVNESIKFLERFKDSYSVSSHQEVVLAFENIKKDFNKANNKLSTLNKIISSLSYVINMIENALNYNDTNSQKYLIEEDINQCMNTITNRFMADLTIKNYVENKLGLVFTRIYVSDFLNKLSSLQDRLKLDSKKNSDYKFAEFFYRLLVKERDNYINDVNAWNVKILKLDNELKYYSKNISANIGSYKNDVYANFVNILPLGANLFVSYMQQLIFITSIRKAYLNLVEIEKREDLNKAQKEEKVVEIIRIIFPVVEKCIRYIMLGGDYPFKERFEFEFKNIY